MKTVLSDPKATVKRCCTELSDIIWPRCRSWRPQWLPRFTAVRNEADVHPHCKQEKGELFLSTNAGSTELEVLNWLYATAIMTKPTTILETGCYDGIGTMALAAACRANGFGQVHSIDIDADSCKRAKTRLKRQGLDQFATVHCLSSLDFLEETNLRFDFGFFDSLCELRPQEYSICMQRNLLNGIAAFHDSSPRRTETMRSDPTPDVHNDYRKRLMEFARDPKVTGYLDLPLSRGLFVVFHQDSSRRESYLADDSGGAVHQ